MISDFDVVIVGSGPAGVSAAFPLVETGLRVLMVDGGHSPEVPPPSGSFLQERVENKDQWKWMIGEDFHALRNMDSVSPKLRVPTHAYAFEGFSDKYQLHTNNFVAVGSLATGGLSNAWGCGVSKLTPDELTVFPADAEEMNKSFETVARRIGISGANDDDMSDVFGLDHLSQAPIEMDELHTQLFHRYQKRNKKFGQSFKLGRSRIAVLSADLGNRKACDRLGNCLWGCERKALYSSSDELHALKSHSNFIIESGVFVDEICRDENSSFTVSGCRNDRRETFRAKKVLLAAGTLGTTKLALKMLKCKTSLPMLSCPIAAFLLWLPRMLGRKRTSDFGYGQLSYAIDLTDKVSAFGSTFSTSGIPVSEFVRHMPFGERYSIDLLSALLSSCLVGNLFLPGDLSSASVQLSDDGELQIVGGYADSVSSLMALAESRLRKSYWRLGALLLPKSFTVGPSGGDIHYAGTLPMKQNPKITETDCDGELVGAPGLHIVDGACLPVLSGKSHTLTIMANADRIGRHMVTKFNHDRGYSHEEAKL